MCKKYTTIRGPLAGGSSQSVNNVEMNDIEDCSYTSPNGNTILYIHLCQLYYYLKWLLKTKATTLTVFFLTSFDSETLPNHETRVDQVAIKKKIVNLEKTDKLRYTRTRSIIISTKDITYAVVICSISEFLGILISTRVVWKNITNCFLLFNIQVDIPLAEIAKEVTKPNAINILEL